MAHFHLVSTSAVLVWSWYGGLSEEKSFETQTLLAGVGVISMQKKKKMHLLVMGEIPADLI